MTTGMKGGRRRPAWRVPRNTPQVDFTVALIGGRGDGVGEAGIGHRQQHRCRAMFVPMVLRANGSLRNRCSRLPTVSPVIWSRSRRYHRIVWIRVAGISGGAAAARYSIGGTTGTGSGNGSGSWQRLAGHSFPQSG